MTSVSELLYQGGQSFHILNDTITLYSEKMDYGYSTVAEIHDKLYYLGNELSNITTAIFAWEYVNNRLLTKTELQQVLIDHKILP